MPCFGECLTYPWLAERVVESSDTAPFDRAAAKEALRNISLAPCRSLPGPRGSGLASVTFHPSGMVREVTVEPPFDATQAGECIRHRMFGARIPRFGGRSVTWSESFSL